MLSDSLTVGQHLRYFAAARRLPSLDRAGDLLAALGYGQYRETAAGALSGGTRQKLNRQATLIAAKILATSILAAAVAVYAGLVLLAFWRPSPAGWLAITAGYAVMAVTYGALGLLLGVLVRGDLEGFFLIIMGGLMDTFLQNPLGNPLANNPHPGMVPLLRPHAVRRRRRLRPRLPHRSPRARSRLGSRPRPRGLVIFRIRIRSHTRSAG